MDKNEFIKRAIKIVPTSINAKLDMHNHEISTSGRAIDILALLLATTESIVNKLPLSIDEYCEILKISFNRQKKNDDFETFQKLFKDLLNEHR